MGDTGGSIHERRRDRALGQMKPALREVYEERGKRIVAADVHDARRRYGIGDLVRKISLDAGTYGSNAVKLLALALGHDKNRLYEAARVTMCWSRDEMEAILAQPTEHRRTLSFSHLALIASVTNTAKRTEYLETCLKLGLSVRELERLVEGRKARSAGRHPMRVAKSLIAQAKTARKWLDELDPRLAASRDTRKLLEEAATEHRLLVKRLEAALNQVQKKITSNRGKAAEGQEESEIFPTSGKSPSALWGGRPDGEA